MNILEMPSGSPQSTKHRETFARLGRVALVHDYFVVSGGAERVAAELHAVFPDAPIFTSATSARALPTSLRKAEVRVSFLQHAPLIARAYRAYLPLYAHAFARLDLSGYDLVIASSSAWAHHVQTDGRLVVYCHSPARFLWQTQEYLRYERRLGSRAMQFLLAPMLRNLRDRDQAAARRAILYLANSAAVAARVERFYGRRARVIPPPVDVGRFRPGKQETFALVVSRLQPYKRLHLAVRACEALQLPLVVVGDGPARGALEAEARGNTTFLGRIDDERVAELMGRAQMLLFPGEEDFGLAPVEANAAGCPVVAFAAGGALETVRDGETGVLFHDPTAESMSAAIVRALSTTWDRRLLVQHAANYSRERFRKEILDVCGEVLAWRSS